ncbi:uncharacterized protein [Rutidosis leptorrhynchoides]|uniref:uncharacterized protein n=1 Tax=Rutidosis leptorrhynchoides TaxID=125765 RepID=UPI003A999D4C
MVFLDLEKAYDYVPRNLIWKILRGRNIPSRYISVIRDMYEGAKSCVRTPVGNTEVFPIEVGLHQGSALNPFLFALILDELSRAIQECISWCLIFADDIVLVFESNEELNRRLEQWRVALEGNGLQISRQNTEYLRCDFYRNTDEQDDGVNIYIRDQILHPQTSFRYLGSMLHKSRRIDEDVSHRIKVGWLKWRAATGALCDRKIPLKLKGKFFKDPFLVLGMNVCSGKFVLYGGLLVCMYVSVFVGMFICTHCSISRYVWSPAQLPMSTISKSSSGCPAYKSGSNSVSKRKSNGI